MTDKKLWRNRKERKEWARRLQSQDPGKCEARLRNRVQSNGKRLGTELSPEWPTSSHHSAGHSCAVHRRNGRGSDHDRPRSCGSIARCLHIGRPRSWRLGQKEQIDRRQIQATPIARVTAS
jgi:hypothetical protein